ncbi:putative pentatricopeptide repeat-containing protein At3g15130 [Wolffia australiana]
MSCTAESRPLRGLLHRIIQSALETRSLSFGSAVHGVLLKSPAHFPGSLSLWNKLLGLYRRCGHGPKTRRLFDEMRERDAVSFNTVISSSPDLSQALSLYSLMRRSGMKPNNITISVLLAASSVSPSPLGLIEQIHAQAVKFELAGDGFVGSALISGYSKSLRIEQASRVFEQMGEVDLVGWNIMIDSCARSGSTERTVEIFSRMRRQPGETAAMDGFSLTSVLKTCSQPDYLQTGAQIHGCALKAGFSIHTPIGNALVTMYSKCRGNKNSIISVFEAIPEKNVISWTAVISGLMQNELYEEAVNFYADMVRRGLDENEFSFASVIPAFAGLASLRNGRLIHARVAKSSHGLDVAIGNALVDMYFKCGSPEEGERAFRTMGRRDVVTWTAMIGGMGQHGKAKEALAVLREMIARGYKPDSVSFLAGLCACSHGGLVEDGLNVFHAMTSVYEIKPRVEHYAALIDLLGRAGKLKEAARFIEDMGLDSDPVAWETLLSACRIHGDTRLGEVSAGKIMELRPRKEAPYIMLSNIYAEKRMWEEKGMLRHRLDAKGLKKDVGCSWSTM